MNDITQALAYIGAYALGILTLLGFIAYALKGEKVPKVEDDEMTMAKAVGVVQEAMPGTTILSYDV